MKTNFHNKNYARSLAFVMRFKASRKWPIVNVLILTLSFILLPYVKTRVLNIYMENPGIPVGNSNGTYYSIWSTSEIMGFLSK